MDLYPFQKAGAEWLSTKTHGGLFDDQGLGKTAQAIVAADRVNAKTILVVAPSVVTHNWKREFGMWADCASVQVISTGRDKINAQNYRVVVVPHALLIRDAIMSQLLRVRWDVCIVDEAHAFKNPKAKRTKALFSLRDDVAAVSTVCRRMWLLTGTPMPNNPTELWTMLRALSPASIAKPFDAAVELEPRPMNWFEFRRKFCELQPSSYGDGWKVTGAKNTDLLRDVVSDFSLRRLKKNVLDLPPIRFGTLTVTGDLPAELLKIEEKIAHLKGMHGVDMMEALRDVVEFSTWRRLCGIAKAQSAGELLVEELQADPTKKLVVFAHHKEVVESILAQVVLGGVGVVTIVGSMDAEARARAVDSFQKDPTTRVCLCNIVAGGVGITLTAASDVVFVEQSFVPGDNAQAADRCYRIGQDKSVLVRNLALAGSVDELLTEILARKTEMIRKVIQ